MAKHLEIKSYELNGVRVEVSVDYDKGTISLTDHRTPKHYVFVDRGIEYMNGWRGVLKAIEFAIGEAEKDLQEHIDMKGKEIEALMVRAFEATEGLMKNFKKPKVVGTPLKAKKK